MKGYMELQLRFIHKYAEQLHIDDESATWEWIRSGLARRFAKIYRERFGLPKEG